MFEVIDSVALVTGGAAGLGLAIVRELLVQKAKAVAIVDINPAGEEVLKRILTEFGPGRAIFVQTDVSKAKELRDAFETTVKTYNQLDVVFNNAGIIDELDWERCIRINLSAPMRGTMLAVEEYLPKYAKKTDPIVVNTASVAAYDVYRHMPVYSATKSGIVSFTKTFGPAFDIYKVKVIAVSPGAFRSSMYDYCVDAVKEQFRKELEELISVTEMQDSKLYANMVLSILRTAPSGSAWKIDREITKMD